MDYPKHDAVPTSLLYNVNIRLSKGFSPHWSILILIFVHREEKTEQLIDVKNELERLDAEMQRLKQEVSVFYLLHCPSDPFRSMYSTSDRS